MKLTNKQKYAIESIKSKLLDFNKIIFLAPTGSGKTLISYAIASYYCNQLNYVTIITTISTSKLYKELHQRYIDYLFDIDEIEPVMINLIDETKYINPDKIMDIKRNLPIHLNGIYIFGNSSYHKGGSLKENGLLRELLLRLKNSNRKILHIKDESHINAQIDNEIMKYVDKQIHMSATPNNNFPIVRMEEDNLLLKQECVKIYKENVEELIDKAFSDFVNLKREYKKYNINPAILIQLNNYDKRYYTYSQLRDIIIKISNKYELKWVKIFHNEIESYDNKKYCLGNLKNNNSEIDVIIFKTSISTGWDIPRATSLIQLREIKSDRLFIQTIGRIRRKSVNNSKRSIFNKYFIYKLNEQEKNEG